MNQSQAAAPPFEIQIPRHSLGKSLFLHLTPGVLITLFFFLTGPLVMAWGFPPLMALLLAILFVLIPFELGILLYVGWKEKRRLTLDGAVLFRQPLPFRQYLIFVPLFLVWGFFWFAVLAPLDSFLIERVFTWLPDWSLPQNYLGGIVAAPAWILWVVVIFGFVLNGIAGPWVEELYFRGYLLPRVSYLGILAPIFNVVLFSLYHFFSPWQNITRIVAMLPVVYLVAWKKNITISIATHVLLNSLGMILTMILIF
jgi:uncharacterized protein